MGLVDLDVCGPSLPTMVTPDAPWQRRDDEQLLPLTAHGVARTLTLALALALALALTLALTLTAEPPAMPWDAVAATSPSEK